MKGPGWAKNRHREPQTLEQQGWGGARAPGSEAAATGRSGASSGAALGGSLWVVQEDPKGGDYLGATLTCLRVFS